MRCDWAACKEHNGLTLEDGWHHCRTHLTWHRAMQAGHDAPPTPLERDVQPCGTPAAARRHHRRGESACVLCRIAAAEYNAKRKAARTA